MKTAVTRYVADHKVPPGAGAATEDPALRAIRMPEATVRLGPGGSIDMLFVSGRLAGKTLSWVPMIQHGKVKWICAHGNMPIAYLPPQCTK
jgi:Pilin (bacterial filament)